MKLGFGSKDTIPTISLSVSTEEMGELERHSGFNQAYDQIVSGGDVVVAESDGRLNHYFLFKRIGRRPQSTHQARLKPVIDVLDHASLLDSEPVGASDLIIGSDQVGDRLPLGLRVSWPEASDNAISESASITMRSIARQLRYDPQIARRKKSYEEHVYAYVNRADHSRTRGVSLQTNPLSSASIETIGDEYEPEEPTFWLECHNIYTHEQQLICLAGALAIAELSEVANSRPMS